VLTGRGAKVVCRSCDEAKVRQHDSAFNAVRVSAQL